MDEQGGAGGVPLEGRGKQDRRRKPHTDRRDGGTTPAADTDEASRLDRPQQPEKPGGKPGRKGTRWVGPRDE
ncbi:hypothetical protein M8Z33_01925 [Streptomyces sp. ZAF1911]|uniref:hypothetical protein n=1 Tax=Streptomyces sp. ZAF1911 TaxID=2944129 RepID=UPI00237BA2E4|nr:hypothetical protein [Streptomyces sp. ZAF1911]MDD9375446.1 hypothetical protein [Streptomyces sp. ZAF1911]